MMKLCIFHEFAFPEVIAAVRQIEGLEVDQAAAPSKYPTSDTEKAVVATNAKLFFPPTTPPAAVDSMLGRLQQLGLQVTQRHPITSAGCPMNDRVILKCERPLPAQKQGN